MPGMATGCTIVKPLHAGLLGCRSLIKRFTRPISVICVALVVE